jgi:4-amino-4-deoxy-L-arabinose transferase-like glycosyltransferase
MNPGGQRGRYLAAGVLVMVILFVAAVRIRLLSVPLERDEGEFAYFAQLLLQGIPPYSHAYSMKLPGMYGAYALIMTLFGQTPEGIHAGLLVVNVVTIFLIFLFAERLMGAYAGVVASSGFAILSMNHSILGVFAHANHFVILLALAGLLLLLSAIDRGSRAILFLSGLFFGLAFTMKQHAVFFVVLAVLYLLWGKARDTSAGLRRMFGRAALLLLGAAIPFLVTCLLLYRAGVFSPFWFWTFTYAREYASSGSISSGAELFLSQASKVVRPSPGLWLLAGAGLVAACRVEMARANRMLILGLSVFSFLAICTGVHFLKNYFILLLPAVSLMIGVATDSVRHLCSAKGRKAASLAIPSLIFLAAAGNAIFNERTFFFTADPVEASRIAYGAKVFPESLEVANYIRSRTTGQDRIVVLGSEPQIYFYANRISATGYIYMYGLMENQKYALRMRREMISEIEAAKPQYLVLVNESSSWLVQSEESALDLFNWAEKYVEKNFEKVGVADILGDKDTLYLWNQDALKYSPRSDASLYVYKRKRS